MSISQKDRQRLRDVAKWQAELAHSPRNEALWRDWVAYGASKQPPRPMIRIEIDTFEKDVLPALMQCEGEEARRIEQRMLRPIANFTLFEDDTLVPAAYCVADYLRFIPFGLTVKRQETGGLGHHFIPYLHDLEEDLHLLGPSQYGINEEGAQREVEQAQELFGDLLPVRRVSNCMYSCPTQDIIHIMNMDDLYVAMIDDEDNFRAMLQRLIDDYIAFYTMLESGKHLRSAARGQHLSQGSYCFTEELPDDVPGASLRQMWLYMDSQETSGISPAMYADLIFPYYRQLMEKFGLVSYGCCEATHPIWDNCLSTLPNLRKVSISPWCDEESMGERLRGTGITFLRKPPATLLGMDGPLDEQATLDCFRKTARAAKGCKLEIAQRDVYRIGPDPAKVRRYVQLARQGLEG